MFSFRVKSTKNLFLLTTAGLCLSILVPIAGYCQFGGGGGFPFPYPFSGGSGGGAFKPPKTIPIPFRVPTTPSGGGHDPVAPPPPPRAACECQKDTIQWKTEDDCQKYRKCDKACDGNKAPKDGSVPEGSTFNGGEGGSSPGFFTPTEEDDIQNWTPMGSYSAWQKYKCKTTGKND